MESGKRDRANLVRVSHFVFVIKFIVIASMLTWQRRRTCSLICIVTSSGEVKGSCTVRAHY